MTFITDRFLLRSATAERLYRSFAANQPILDYHCHLPAREIAENRRFKDLSELWLEGDHYKWRAMRANGVPERYCTGDAEPYEKFLAWARTVPFTLRNPLYHWTHLELARYFDIHELLDETSAPAIWRRASARLAGDELTAHGILDKFRVHALCTTDDPADTLDYHRQIAASPLRTAVYPCFRPDRALQTEDPARFNAWVDRLGRAANVDIIRLPHLLDALRRRHDDFHEMGCRLSDHGLNSCPAEPCSDEEAARVFEKVRSGSAPDPNESWRFGGYLMILFGHLDAKRNWTKQLHLGALRSANTRMKTALGPDTGFDAIDDQPQARALAAYLDRLAREDALPKVILYNVNPADNYVLATIAGCFQEAGPSKGAGSGREPAPEKAAVPARIQFGSAWWFLDQRESIEWQLNALSNTGLLSRFVGMLTDSRSFMSYPRHEYFRRILCNLLGGEMDRGELPSDEGLIGRLIEDVSFRNALRYFELPGRETATGVRGRSDGGSAASTAF